MISLAPALDRLFAALHLPPLFRTLPSVLSIASPADPRAFFLATPDARHWPLATTLATIPTVWVLGHLSGNVSWVDRIWTTFPLVTTLSVMGWASTRGEVACIPRLMLVLALQTVWSIRLTRHTARRGLYNLDAEDYRYVVMRKLIPALAFELIHIFLVAIAQPMLLFALSLPVAALAVPGHMLSAGPWPSTAVRYGTLATWLPSMFAAGTFNPTTPVLHVGDALLALATLAAVALEGAGDNAMHAFQSAKHAEMKRLGTELVENPESEGKLKPSLKRTPKPVAVPHGFEPGFPTKGLHAYVRHPNFAGEQAFWLSQGLFALAAVTRPDALTALGPALMVSMLFVGSTALTEWITTCKYPAYKAYTRLVGKFVPQATAIKWVITTLVGVRERLAAEVWK